MLLWGGPPALRFLSLLLTPKATLVTSAPALPHSPVVSLELHREAKGLRATILVSNPGTADDIDSAEIKELRVAGATLSGIPKKLGVIMAGDHVATDFLVPNRFPGKTSVDTSFLVEYKTGGGKGGGSDGQGGISPILEH